MNHGLAPTSISFWYSATQKSVSEVETLGAFIVIDDCETWKSQTKHPMDPLSPTVS